MIRTLHEFKKNIKKRRLPAKINNRPTNVADNFSSFTFTLADLGIINLEMKFSIRKLEFPVHVCGISTEYVHRRRQQGYVFAAVCLLIACYHDQPTLQNMPRCVKSCKPAGGLRREIHTHTRLTALFLGLPRRAGTRKVKPIWILLKQERVSGSGINWAVCKSAP